MEKSDYYYSKDLPNLLNNSELCPIKLAHHKEQYIAQHV